MIKICTIAATALGMMTVAAQAGDSPKTIHGWVDQASTLIEAKMEFPETAKMVGDIGTNSFAVTVNKNGDILDVKKQDKAKNSYFDEASYKALRYIDLPDLPESYDKDTMTFRLVFDYIQNERDLALLHDNDKKEPKIMFAKTRKDKDKESVEKETF